jgi:hypothetical protein
VADNVGLVQGNLATAAISDDMVARIFLFGSADQCHAQARADYAAGIDALAMSPQADTAEAFAYSAGVFAAAAFNPAPPARAGVPAQTTA